MSESSESSSDVPVQPAPPIVSKPSVNNKPKLPAAPAPPVKTISNGSSNGSGSPAGVRVLRPEAYVGFDSLPEQYVARIIRNGFGFNIMALGATGIGKTTLFESLFNIKLNHENLSTRSHAKTSVEVASHQLDLTEGNIKLKLTLVESKGFDDQLDKTDSFKPIVEYIDAQFEKYLQEELKIHRSESATADSRIHCCIYMVAPHGHGLHALDLVTLKALHNKVNIIPVIAMSDTITKSELDKLRTRIMNELNSNGIEYYKFPVDDPEVQEVNSANNSLVPFAIVASSDFMRIGSKQVRARQYPWGNVHVENEAHCDFVKLRDMVVRINMEDLRDTTHSKHYEHYRHVRLQQMGFGGEETVNGNVGGHPASFKDTFESHRQTHLKSLQRREEEMRAAFVQRVKVKEAELKNSESELHHRFNRMKQESQEMKRQLDMQKSLLEEEMAAFAAKKAAVLGSTATLMHGLSGKMIDKSKKK